MAIALTRKLEQFTRLSAEDKQVLTQIAERVRVFSPHEDLVHEGDRPSQINVITPARGGTPDSTSSPISRTARRTSRTDD